MNEETKSFWKKPWKGARGFLLWFVLLAAAAFVALFIVGLASGLEARTGRLAGFALLYAAGLALFVVGAIAFFRWIFCWRNFKKFQFGLACFAALVALFYAEEDWRGWHAWHQFQRQEAVRGEKFDWPSVVPPPAPDDQNFAMTPIWVELIASVINTNVVQKWYGPARTEQSLANRGDRLDLVLTADGADWPTNGSWQKATLTDLAPWQKYYRALAAKTNLFPVASEPQTPAQDVLLALSIYNSTIEKMRQAGELPDARFPLDYDRDDVWSILLPHLAVLKRCSQVLQLRAIAELQNGQGDPALADVKLSLRLMDSIRGEPFLISHLVRIAMLQITLQPVYEGLAKHQWSDAQLAELDSELAKLDFLADYKLAMRGERGCNVRAVEYLRHRNLRRFNEIFDISGNNDHVKLSFAALGYYLSPSGWFYQNELRFCRFYDKWYLPLADEKTRTVSPAGVRAAEHAQNLELRHRPPENYLESLLLPALGKAVQKFAYARGAADLARVACALERYRLANGVYPDSLSAVAPHFPDGLPNDVITGEPLHYRLAAGGQFVLYSVGWNERDDGGKPGYARGGTAPRPDMGDWVWRYPVNAE